MNRKGDVPMTLTIPVTLVLVIYALFSFYSFNTNFSLSSQTVSDMVEELHFSLDYVTVLAVIVANESVHSGTNDLKKDFQMRIASHDLQMDGVGNFFGKIRTGDFMFEEKDGKILLEIKGLFVKSVRGANEMKREFEIVKSFDKAVSQLIVK